MDQVIKLTRDIRVGDILLYCNIPAVITSKVETQPNRYTIWLSYLNTYGRTVIVSSFQAYFTGDSQPGVVIIP
jgi:hypothetical protein